MYFLCFYTLYMLLVQFNFPMGMNKVDLNQSISISILTQYLLHRPSWSGGDSWNGCFPPRWMNRLHTCVSTWLCTCSLLSSLNASPRHDLAGTCLALPLLTGQKVTVASAMRLCPRNTCSCFPYGNRPDEFINPLGVGGQRKSFQPCNIHWPGGETVKAPPIYHYCHLFPASFLG